MSGYSSSISRNKLRFSLFVLMLLLTAIVAITIPSASASSETATSDIIKLKDDLKSTYLRLAVAEEKGANVTSACTELDKALQLINQANNDTDALNKDKVKEAAEIVQKVNALIPSLTAEGESRTLWNNVGLDVMIFAIIALCLLVYFYLPKLMWNLWAKSRRNWRIETV